MGFDICTAGREWHVFVSSKPGWWFHIFSSFTSTWGDDPIWLAHIFQKGGFNHQLETHCVTVTWISGNGWLVLNPCPDAAFYWIVLRMVFNIPPWIVGFVAVKCRQSSWSNVGTQKHSRVAWTIWDDTDDGWMTLNACKPKKPRLQFFEGRFVQRLNDVMVQTGRWCLYHKGWVDHIRSCQ